MQLRVFFSSLLDTIFPARRKPGRSWASITPSYFESLAARATQDQVLARAGAIALFSYNDPLVKEALHELKYNGKREVAVMFGELMAEHLREELSHHRLVATRLPLLVPVPVTFGRYIERSYNQTELIAQEMATRLTKEVEYVPELLARKEFRGSNALAPTRRERSENVRGVFIVSDPELVANRDIILVDDIITTGATTNEVAATLLSCGAHSVSCIAIAH